MIDQVQRLVDTLAGTYPTRLAELSNRPGVVTVVVTPTGGDWDQAAQCGLIGTVSCDVTVLAAGTGQQAVADLLTHIDPVARLVGQAGWQPVSWRTSDVDQLAAVLISVERTL